MYSIEVYTVQYMVVATGVRSVSSVEISCGSTASTHPVLTVLPRAGDSENVKQCSIVLLRQWDRPATSIMSLQQELSVLTP